MPGLSEAILRAVSEEGYDTPTPIQAKAIPAVLEGRDIMAAAQTGTGKTAGFTLPLLQRLQGGASVQPNQARALVLTPTRELAAQVGESVATYGKYLPLRSAVVFGGVNINPQMMKLRRGVDILVATPGRLLDLYQQNAVRFNRLEILVLDEADRMLDMGFIHDIRKILALLPAGRQNLMFSATFSDEIRKLAKGLVNDPVEISVTPRNAAAPSVKQWITPVDKKMKARLLSHLVSSQQWNQVLVFTRTKHGANKLTQYLEGQGIKAAAIHGNKSQAARTKALADFKHSRIQLLIATDIAARGLDIDQLPHVVNFDLPNVPEDYVHRIGRTGRAGSTGEAVSLVSHDEFDQLAAIEHLTQKILQREVVEGFEPIHDLPVSRLGARPARSSRPNSPQSASRGRNQGAGAGRSSANRSGGRSGQGRSAGSTGQGAPGRSGTTGRSSGNGSRSGASGRSGNTGAQTGTAGRASGSRDSSGGRGGSNANRGHGNSSGNSGNRGQRSGAVVRSGNC